MVVCSGNAPNFSFPVHQAFIYDQLEAISRVFPEFTFDTFFVTGKGIKGYLKNFTLLKKKIIQFKPDLLHAHGGHTGFLCGLLRKPPVVVTFHGSDINQAFTRIVSFVATLFCNYAIFVNPLMPVKMPFLLIDYSVIPCGVNLDQFYPARDDKVREEWLKKNEPYILFSSHFTNPVKNFLLAREALDLCGSPKIVEIKNRSREEVNQLLNGAELLLLTSFSEGSPQIIKEAMACNCPVVATDVGDIREVAGNTEGCFITSFDPADVADKIKKALAYGKRTNGRDKIKHLDNRIIAEKVVAVYEQVLSENSGKKRGIFSFFKSMMRSSTKALFTIISP